jgi:hypothetical protein
MKVLLILFCACCLLFTGGMIPGNDGNDKAELHDQVRQIAIKDFSKTKLYRMDSVFHVSVYDTVHREVLQKINENHYKWVPGKAYNDIIAVDILGSRNKIFLDTSINISTQTAVQSRYIEQNGKLFIWWDSKNLLTNSTVQIMDKYHLIQRGKGNDWMLVGNEIDESKQGVTYYFCRNNLSVYKKVITSRATGSYEPPKINCK